ncbi:unnamed protein product [Brassica rapa]|uniref:Uncharacterized protein n=1 Tax=Brassica campestris TaxID=3711 RepID=A0A8D9H2N6_BRACM|nr:unnamed protein product [Brassica napus]CAG7890494.1 unnamed protein product [Brassica rapa]
MCEWFHHELKNSIWQFFLTLPFLQTNNQAFCPNSNLILFF